MLATMDGKPRPNHRAYLHALRRLTPAQRLATALELGDLSRELLWCGLRRRFPDAPVERLESLYAARIERCRRLSY